MRRLASLWAMTLAIACVRENEGHGDLMSDGGLVSVSVVTCIDGTYPSTRSILGETTIEDKVTGVSLASYSADGRLLDARHYEEGTLAKELWVDASGTNTLYALVNMGDVTGRFPVDEADVAGMTYVLSSYENVAESGIPMCGMRKNVSSEELPVIVDVERLFAKVRVRILHTMLSGAGEEPYAYNLCNKSLYMRQANAVLSPFGVGGSRARRKDDVWNIADYNADMNDRYAYDGSLAVSQLGPGPGYFQDTTFVFYLPENNQGVLLPDNSSPAEKVYDKIALLDGVPYGDLCTYVEFNAKRENTGNGYFGDLTYRFYLGCDNTSDFSLKRNSVYNLTLNLSERHMLSDGWEVTRGNNWTDTRTLKFLKAPYVIYQGQLEKVMIHYHRNAAGAVSSEALPEDWTLEVDEGLLAEAGLSYNFDPDLLVKGENGISDFCVEFEASEDAEVGTVIPLVISSWDGGLKDYATLTVARLGEMTVGWDFTPRYVSQYGMVTARNVPVAKRPVTLSCGDPEMVDFKRVNDTTFRVVAKASGTVELDFSNADGSQTCKTVLNVMPPRLKVTDGVITLNPDGEPVRLFYTYLDNRGELLENVDNDVFMTELKPAASGSGFIVSEASDKYMDIALGCLSDGEEKVEPGRMYNIEIASSGCREVGSVSKIFVVEDPFKSIGTEDYGRLDDFTLFSLDNVNPKIAGLFSEKIWIDDGRTIPAPVPDASTSYVSAELRPLWTNGYSSDNDIYMLEYSLDAGRRCWKIRMDRPGVQTSHSAGRHELVLQVRNRHSSETLEHVCGTMDVYLHTMLGARALFGFGRADAVAADGRTMAQVYNSLAGRNVYSSSSYMYFMDVCLDYFTPVDGVPLLSALKTSAASNSNMFDSLYIIKASENDGFVDIPSGLLYSVTENDRIRMSLGEPSGVRSGIGKLLYRAYKIKNYASIQSESSLKIDFLGYTGSVCLEMYAPRYSVHDIRLGYDSSLNRVERNGPYYFSPSSYPSYRDADGKGYYVIHFLEDTLPQTMGWTNVLQ